MITPTEKVDFSSISEVVAGSGITPEHINAPLRASAYAQEYAGKPTTTYEGGNITGVSIDGKGRIEYDIDEVETEYVDDSTQVYGIAGRKLPIVAGENVTFEVDGTNDVVKINASGNGVYVYAGDIPEETSELEKANMFTTPQDRDFIDGDIIISTNGVMVTVSGGTTDTLIYVEYAGKIEPSINAEDLPNMNYFEFGYSANADTTIIERNGIRATYTNTEIEYEDKNDNVAYQNPSVTIKLPIVAGENVTFEKDDTNQTVKINASVVSNPNILINSNFAINQRGATSYATANQYTVDRWMLNGGTLIVNADGTITHTSSGVTQGIRQVIEKPSRFAGENLTFSFNGYNTTSALKYALHIKRSNASHSTVIGSVYEEPISTTANVFSGTATVPNDIVDDDILYLEIVSTTPSSMILNWVKLEEGESATPYTTPDLALELMRCQRYYEKSSIRDICGFAVSTSQITNGYIKYKVTKRTIPTITVYSSSANTSGYLQKYGSNTDEVMVAIDTATRSENSFFVYSSARFVVGQLYCGYYIADAELYI